MSYSKYKHCRGCWKKFGSMKGYVLFRATESCERCEEE